MKERKDRRGAGTRWPHTLRLGIERPFEDRADRRGASPKRLHTLRHGVRGEAVPGTEAESLGTTLKPNPGHETCTAPYLLCTLTLYISELRPAMKGRVPMCSSKVPQQSSHCVRLNSCQRHATSRCLESGSQCRTVLGTPMRTLAANCEILQD